jgi:hypothetical protein
MFRLLNRLFGAVSGSEPTPELVLAPDARADGGTWREVPKAYVVLEGNLSVHNTSPEPVEIVHIDVRRAGAKGGASDVRAAFTPYEIPSGATAALQFSVPVVKGVNEVSRREPGFSANRRLVARRRDALGRRWQALQVHPGQIPEGARRIDLPRPRAS